MASAQDIEENSTGISRQDLQSVEELQDGLGEQVAETDGLQTHDEPNEQLFGLNEDVMTVQKHEVPAEISLMAGSGGWDKVIGLEYMAPRVSSLPSMFMLN